MGGIKLLTGSNEWEQWVVLFSVILNMYNQGLCHPVLPLPFPLSIFLPFFLWRGSGWVMLHITYNLRKPPL
jgi:hypothetical protein